MSSRGVIRAGWALTACLGLALSIAQAEPRPTRRSSAGRRTEAVIVVGPERPVRQRLRVLGVPAGALDLNLKPKATEVWIDGRLRGIADDFDGLPRKLLLTHDPHRLRLVTPDGVELARDIRVRAGTEDDIDLDLR